MKARIIFEIIEYSAPFEEYLSNNNARAIYDYCISHSKGKHKVILEFTKYKKALKQFSLLSNIITDKIVLCYSLNQSIIDEDNQELDTYIMIHCSKINEIYIAI